MCAVVIEVDIFSTRYKLWLDSTLQIVYTAD